ncbi:golgin subfamily A member 7 [Lepeophtheirus salmonis]|nr:golgin subfamily A member 7-like [Lepeophtheirus salmonis]ACO12760.1 Golgin subfamily A member 7 [Lepeophtheirus salmonis]
MASNTTSSNGNNCKPSSEGGGGSGNPCVSISNCRKIYVQRDYGEGSGVKFQTRFPSDLEGKIIRDEYDYTITTMNSMYEEAERANCSTFCEGCMACVTAYLIYFCSETHYEKCLKKVSRFVAEQNERVWTKRGLLITDPIEKGLRVIEISVLTEPALNPPPTTSS